MNAIVHRLVIPVLFPEGVSPGAGRDGNSSILALDGRGKPLLRGTAIAGALRHAWEHQHPNDDSTYWFGASAGTDSHCASPLKVLDAPFEAPTEQRMHNAMDRHRGAVRDNALFTVASISADCRTSVVLHITSDRDPHVVDRVKIFLAEILSFISDGMTFGGNVARGIGRATLDPVFKPKLRSFDLSDIEQHGAWLDEQRQIAENPPDTGTILDTNAETGDILKITFKLHVAPGQDVLIGGLNLDGVLEQQQCVASNGKEYFRIPGSSMKGVLRSWISRLAARESIPIADHVGRFELALPHERTKAHDPGWGFADEATRRAWIADPSNVACPIMKLFGSFYAKGRLHCSDARVLKTTPPAARSHVSIDRISGGASEGFLFQTRVMEAASNAFEFVVTIDRPTEQESKWLMQTLKAIDLGVLRIGSTKGSGRLKLADKVLASGTHSALFENLGTSGGVR